MFDINKIQELRKSFLNNDNLGDLEFIPVVCGDDSHLPKALDLTLIDNDLINLDQNTNNLVAIGCKNVDHQYGYYAALFLNHGINNISGYVLQGIGRVKLQYVQTYQVNGNNFYRAYNCKFIQPILDYPKDCQPYIDEIKNSLSRLLINKERYLDGSDFIIELNKLSVQDQLMELLEHISPILKLFQSDPNLWYQIYSNLLASEHISVLIKEVMYVLDQAHEFSQTELALNRKVRRRMEEHNLDFYLREKINVIQEELGVDNSASNFRQLIEHKLANYPEVKNKLMSDVKRLEQSNPHSPENEVTRNYLDKVLNLPWGKCEELSNDDINSISLLVEKSHYGMEAVKNSLIDFVASYKRRSIFKQPELQTPILCLVGPPGVGKTSIAKALGKIIGKTVCSFSLAGLTDQHEIRGHRRTYIGATMGYVMDSILQAKVDNPIFILDEIDKIGSSQLFNSLLELLDTAHNTCFRDAFVDVGYDLSRVWFICTANDLRQIPAPLLDRMHVVHIAGYTLSEKIHIANNYLIAESQKNFCITSKQLKIPNNVLVNLINDYTFESGVRDLKNYIYIIFMKVATLLCKHGENYSLQLTTRKLHELLDEPIVKRRAVSDKPCVGVCNGLAYLDSGIGDTIQIESVVLENGSGELNQTGNLGKVMRESIKVAQILALNCLRKDNKLQTSKIDTKAIDIHVHLPESIAKDGPSAGVGICIAMLSCLCHLPVKAKLAFTGEVNLQGFVMPVGGIREKLQGAILRGVKEVCLPADNMQDVKRVPKEIVSKLKVYYINRIEEAYAIAFCQ